MTGLSRLSGCLAHPAKSMPAGRRPSPEAGIDDLVATIFLGWLQGGWLQRDRVGLWRRSPPFIRHVTLTTVTVTMVLLSSACGSSSGSTVLPDPKTSTPASLAGRPLSPTVVQPTTRLTDTNGSPFDVRSGTAGKLTFVFFGYTHCPDVCPTTVADIAAALSQQTPAVRARTALVFVTTDPDRDSPQTIRRWLDQFDVSFIGLTGSWADIAGYATALGLPTIHPEQAPDGTWTVDHVSRVTAFSPDGTARLGYLASATVANYSHDIPLLLENRM